METPITFRPLTEADLPRLHEWVNRPHVRAWWDGDQTLEEVWAMYQPFVTDPATLPLDAAAGVIQYFAYEGGGEPFGFIQTYRVMAHQADGWWVEETDPHALGIDQFIADPARLGQGLGTRMVRAFVAMLFTDPRVSTIQTDPDPLNGRAVACYRKAGFRDVGVVDTPDGPALLMRVSASEVAARQAFTRRRSP